MSKRCVLYSRVSTDGQERDGSSLDTQERACIDYARSQGWELVDRVRDTASGFTLERWGLSHVRDLAKKGSADVILSYALDRLSRKQTHVAILVEEMEERGVAIEFVTEKFEDTATGQLLRSVKAFAAEFEREKIAERTMRGKAERARSGRLPQATGRGMYGYRYNPVNGRREMVSEQAVAVRRIFEAFVGGMSIMSITNALNGENVPTMQGKQWSPATIFHLLHNEGYAGRTTYRRLKAIKVRDPETGQRRRKLVQRPKEEWINVPDATPALVSDELFIAAQARLNDPERLRQGRRRSTYGLAGRIKCKRCGASMVGQTLRGHYRYYRCRRAFAGPRDDRCDSRYIRADVLEETLVSQIAELLSRPEIVLAELQRSAGGTNSSDERSKANSRIDALERQRTRVLKLYQMGEIDDEYLLRESRNIQIEREVLMALLRTDEPDVIQMPESAELAALCSRVREWVTTRGKDEIALIGRALQLSIIAGNDSSLVNGLIPEYASECNHADVRSMVINSQGWKGSRLA